MGRSIVRTASNTVGRKPSIMPRTVPGIEQSHASQLYVLHNCPMLDTIPTNATAKTIIYQYGWSAKSEENVPGIAQKMIKAAVAA